MITEILWAIPLKIGGGRNITPYNYWRLLPHTTQCVPPQKMQILPFLVHFFLQFYPHTIFGRIFYMDSHANVFIKKSRNYRITFISYQLYLNQFIIATNAYIKTNKFHNSKAWFLVLTYINTTTECIQTIILTWSNILPAVESLLYIF